MAERRGRRDVRAAYQAIGHALSGPERDEKRVDGRFSTVDTTQGAQDALRAVYGAMSEREFQRVVVAHLRRQGWLVWHVPNMKQTTAGLPDLFCIHAGHPLILLWELKGEKTRVTPIQRSVIEVLMQVPGVDARILRPSGWENIRDVLDSGRLLELHRRAAREALEPAPAARREGE